MPPRIDGATALVLLLAAVACGAPRTVVAEDASAESDFACVIDSATFRPELQSEWRDYTLNTLNGRRRGTLSEGIATMGRLGRSGPLHALDLGAGAGNDTRHLLGDGHAVHAVEPDSFAVAVIEECALQQGTSARLEVQASTFVDMTLPESAYDFVNASLSLPFAAPATFPAVWDGIVRAMAPGAVFSGDFFGPEHEWADSPDMTFLDAGQVRALFETHDLEILEFSEEKREAGLANGGTAFFHDISVVALKPR